jgi:O-methyltransferase involved in polyketide biosynthesis
MEQMNTQKDYSAISPSAKWMLLWKGHTNIPFAREVAELLEYPNKYIPDFNKKDYTFWASTLGLEARYWSIDQLLNGMPAKNILELSSGYSFRGLAFTRQQEVHYIDTDLPDVIAAKKGFMNSLTNNGSHTHGRLELLSLNVLDAVAFHGIIGRFSQGEVAIVNEGLLGYLNKQEKEQLCSTIHGVLMERGGCWITADILIKDKETKLGLVYHDEITKFNEQQHTEDNSFESFQEAEKFFNNMGFVIDQKAKIKYSDMSSFKYLKRSMTLRQLLKIRRAGHIQVTWRLRAV